MNMGQRSKKWARLKNGKPVNGVKYGSRPTVVSFPEFDKTKPSFLLNLPTELLMEIIGHVYSSRDLRSLQEAHPIFDEIITGPYSNSLLSTIAIRKWKPMGGLPLLDIICNRLTNPRLRQSFLVQSKKERMLNGFDLYTEFAKDRPWPAYSPTLSDSIAPGASYEVPVDLAVLERMDTIEEKVIQPLLRIYDDPLSLKTRAEEQPRGYWNLSKSTIRHALFLFFGAFKYYERSPAPGETHVEDLGIGSTGKYDEWSCGYRNKGFIEEFDLVNHWRIVAIGLPMYIRGLEDTASIDVVRSLGWNLLKMWKSRVVMVWVQTYRAGLADQVLKDEELFVSPQDSDYYAAAACNFEDSIDLIFMEKRLWLGVPPSQKFDKMINILEKLSKAHNCAVAKLGADPADVVAYTLRASVSKSVTSAKVFQYSSHGKRLGGVDPLQRNSIARAI